MASIFYFSKSLDRNRRMHSLHAPGLRGWAGQIPGVLPAAGRSDSDDSWSSVGRAGFILDNLIAAAKAKPMVVVMPAGHSPR